MKDKRINIVIYVCMLLGAVIIGGNVVGYAFSGLITLLSFVFLVESISTLKWLVAKCSYLIDVLLFCFAVYAKVHFSVTLAMALMFGTIGFTLLYAPYVRDTYGK
jgi:hypothetical protein